MPVSPARSAAFEILLRVERESSYASELLHSSSCARLSPRDHGLATELVMGVLRWRSRLDHEIRNSSSQPLAKLDLEVLIALRLALFQFRFLDRVPARAAVNESVELVKRARMKSAAPFVNAVLRKLSGKGETYQSQAIEGDSPASIAKAFAHPLWLVERWAREYGLIAVRKICEYDQSIPVTAIRLRTAAAETDLAKEGVVLGDAALLSSARCVKSGEITKTRAFRERQIAIQDEASQLVAALAVSSSLKTESNASLRVLDCCAAPGGKTLAMADKSPDAALTAVDIHPHRARLLEQLLRGPAIKSRIQVIAADARRLPVDSQFDRVLADVPCSGSGTLARNPEIKWRLEPDDLRDLNQRQCEILRSAMAQVAPGGRLIYSTCSLEREENEDVVEALLAENNSLRLIDCGLELDRLRAGGELIWRGDPLTRGPHLRTIPGVHPCEGFFAAIMERS